VQVTAGWSRFERGGCNGGVVASGPTDDLYSVTAMVGVAVVVHAMIGLAVNAVVLSRVERPLLDVVAVVQLLAAGTV